MSLFHKIGIALALFPSAREVYEPPQPTQRELEAQKRNTEQKARLRAATAARKKLKQSVSDITEELRES